MISSLDPASQILLADLDRIDDKLDAANRQLSSGLRVNVASDDPGAVADILDLQTGIGRIGQIISNLGRVKAEVDTADSALQNAVKLMDRARTLATMGATTTYDAGSRQAMAAEIAGILQSMVALANSTANGRYVFGGDADTVAPYKYDAAQPDSVDRTSAPPPPTRMIEQADGSTFVAGRSAQEIFDDGANSVFTALSQLADALASGDPAQVEAVMDPLRGAAEHLNAQLTFYGTTTNTIKEADNVAHRQKTQFLTSLSQTRDADLPAAIVELERATLNQQAALGAFSKRPHTSLFDYLG